ncbi:sigma-70 family RNA polymerase sigma factor [Variovorax sp. J22R115]|uniref:sigma-70 family RNA polymerase sigma factor n=1 Tax=Variovorax sp. J22R115 TaxID=3053509 RepID=UPI002575A247|nr:sigma-70 family RNA polymerase sigma factor [Variovorax sp. J22R115]MDM0049745.1 sigma-70 family RNA polymerase sigma factor [Variovorax sp. J22R115]
MTTHSHRKAMPTSEELNGLARAVAVESDRQAFAVLFKHFAPRVKTYLILGGTGDALAEEITQETMVNVWRRASTFDPDRASVSTWIFTIARNLRVDYFRRQDARLVYGAEEEAEAQADTQPALDEHVLARERESRVRVAMARLPDEQALVLRLSFFEERPHARIAAELGIPLGTVKSRVRLAVNQLRRLLNGIES